MAIVGGGIIGTTAALALQDDGLRVAVFEPAKLGTGTAEGSAGYLHDGEIFPVGQPALLLALPKMLLDPMGPLVFQFSYLPLLLGWSLRFVRSMRASAIKHAISALADLNRKSVETLATLAASAGGAGLIERRGGFDVCRDQRTFERMTGMLDELSRGGIAAQALDAKEVGALEPGLTTDIAGALWFPNSGHCTDLAALGELFAARVRARGTVVPARVDSISPDHGGWVVRYRNGTAGSLRAGQVLVAAGPSSDRLLRPLGYRVPLAAARGYHLTIAEPGVEVRRPMIFHEPHFAATPMKGALRLAGTMEFARSATPPNMRRAEMLHALASRYLPGLRRGEATAWMGVRSATPDSLPAIGRARRHAGLYYAFGHGHLGLTQSAVSARCVADLIAGRTPFVDLRPFDIARFE